MQSIMFLDKGPLEVFECAELHNPEVGMVRNTNIDASPEAVDAAPAALDTWRTMYAPFVTMLSTNFGFIGSGTEDVNECVTDATKVIWFAAMQDFLYGSSFPSGAAVDIAELCGGMATTSRMLVRRGYVTGQNFDIVVGFDLENEQNEYLLFVYIDHYRPYIFILHPPCTGLKGFKELNEIIHAETFQRNRRKSFHIGRIAGRVTIVQSSAGRHWFVEQPKGSDMFQLKEWIEISQFACWM